MKNYMFYFFFLSFFFSMSIVTATFCCNDTATGVRRCWSSGACCMIGTPEEYWHPSGCFDFKVWVEPRSRMFTIAKREPVNLYLKNEGYPDDYEIEGKVIQGNPALIYVDMSYASSADDVLSGELRILNPMITVYSTLAGSGVVLFNVTSLGEPSLYKNATLTILEGMPISLPEFDDLSFFVLLILLGVVYFFGSKH